MISFLGAPKNCRLPVHWGFTYLLRIYNHTHILKDPAYIFSRASPRLGVARSEYYSPASNCSFARPRKSVHIWTLVPERNPKFTNLTKSNQRNVDWNTFHGPWKDRDKQKFFMNNSTFSLSISAKSSSLIIYTVVQFNLFC